MIQLGEHFRSDEKSRHSDWLRRRQWFIKARRDQVRKADMADRQADEMISLAAETIMATEIQIEEFKVKLDTYDEATVIALMENQEQLDAINAQIFAMLERAYVMEDGRRVFKTEDGEQVFDEFGKEVTRDELDFDRITPDMPTWEAFSEASEIRKILETEKTQILEFQGKVDAARERIADGSISKDELDDLDAELAEAVPSPVKANLSGLINSENTLAVKTAFTVEANPSSLNKAAAATMGSPAPAYDPMG